jgi:4-amino-4-deoxy-L-arabinose transferase-like glycosyltransferase
MDPGYAYLMNSLNLANLRRPYFFGHPGTPVHEVGAVVIRLMNLGSSKAAMTQNVLRDPERYITAINGVLVVFCGLCVLIAGYVALDVTGSLFAALLIQATPFVSVTTLAGLTSARPEPLMIGVAMLIVAVTLLTLKFGADRHSLRYAIAFALLVGIAVAAKVSFAPVALLPLIILPSRKSRLWFLLATAVVFLVSIIPILSPPLVREMIAFMFNLASHTGRYGSGQAGFIDPSSYVSAATKLVRDDALFFIIMAVGVVVLALKSKFQSLGTARRRILIAVTAAQLLQLLLVAKHPHSRYLIPGLALAGLNLVLLADAFAEKLPAAFRWAPALLIGLTIAGVQFWTSGNLFRELRSDQRIQSEAYAAVNRQFPNVPVVTYYTASSPYYALAFGEEWGGNLFGAELQKLYPNQFFYNPWTRKFSDFTGPKNMDQVRGTSNWFVLRGCSLSDPDFKAFLTPQSLPDNVVVEAISGTDVDRPGVLDCEAVYKVTVKPAP